MSQSVLVPDWEQKPDKSYRSMKSVNTFSPGRSQCNGIRRFGPFGFSHPDCRIQTFVSMTFLIGDYPIRIAYSFATVPNLYKKVKNLVKPAASHWPVGPAQKTSLVLVFRSKATEGGSRCRLAGPPEAGKPLAEIPVTGPRHASATAG
jgi:hypothetical protein